MSDLKKVLFVLGRSASEEPFRRQELAKVQYDYHLHQSLDVYLSNCVRACARAIMSAYIFFLGHTYMYTCICTHITYTNMLIWLHAHIRIYVHTLADIYRTII